jgi:transcriptional regulator with XRE-family HTH domain
MNINQFIKKTIQKDSKALAAVEYDLSFHIGRMIINARLATGMTQAVLAHKIGTQQPAIARIENGDSLPSLGMLDKIAKRAFGSYLVPPRFGFMQNDTFFSSGVTSGAAGGASGTLNKLATTPSIYFPLSYSPAAERTETKTYSSFE